jgi:hypothetical protein
MFKQCLAGIAFASLLTVAFSGAVCSDDSRRAPSAASSPEKAVESFLAALKNKEYTAAIEFIAQPYHDLMLYRYLTERNQAFEDALLVKKKRGRSSIFLDRETARG